MGCMLIPCPGCSEWRSWQFMREALQLPASSQLPGAGRQTQQPYASPPTLLPE